MTEPRIRILLAKIGLDGHDRGVKLLARSFRDAGFEVIYTGLWQTSESTVHAAAQEDVDIVGVSLLSAAHMTIMPELLRWRTELQVRHIPVVLGGIVPETDYEPLREMGIAAVFNPGSSIDGIVSRFRELAAARQRPALDQLLAGYGTRRPQALAQLITAVQREADLGGWFPPAGKACVVGVTGAPGVGKSLFIGRLGKLLNGRGHKVAVVAVDPSSPITAGALLGDRLRMMSAQPVKDFFVRSVADGSQHNAVAPYIDTVIALMRGFGFDVILVETVGAGQADTGIHRLTPNVLLLQMPEAGDEIQFAKAGIMEIASAFVVNKADLPRADATFGHLTAALGDGRPIWKVSSARSEGLDEVADWVESLPR